MQTSTGTLVDFFSASSGRTTPDFFSIESPDTAADLGLSAQTSPSSECEVTMEPRLKSDFSSAQSQLAVYNDPVVPIGASTGHPGSFEDFVLDRIATYQANHETPCCKTSGNAKVLCNSCNKNSNSIASCSGNLSPSLSKEGNWCEPQFVSHHLSNEIKTASKVNIKGLNHTNNTGSRELEQGIILSPSSENGSCENTNQNSGGLSQHQSGLDDTLTGSVKEKTTTLENRADSRISPSSNGDQNLSQNERNDAAVKYAGENTGAANNLK